MFLVRIFYYLYFTGLAIIILHCLSELCYSELPKKERFLTFFKRLRFAPFYPLSIFSEKGRKKLGNFINNLLK